MKQPELTLTLNKLPKINTHSYEYKEEIQRIIENYLNYCHIFTYSNKTGRTVILDKKKTKTNPLKDASIFSAEAHASRCSTHPHLEKQQKELYNLFQYSICFNSPDKQKSWKLLNNKITKLNYIYNS